MTSGLFSVAKGGLPLASDVNQLVTGLQGTTDLGQVRFFAPLGAPTGAPTSAANGSGNLTGTYGWVATACTGGVDDAGNLYITGETLPSPVSTALALSSNQATVGNLPTGTAGVVAVRVYRNEATGSATTGPFYLVQQIDNNTTASIPDNVPDSSLGALAPVQNTTGSSLAGLNALTHGGALTALLNFAGNVNTSRGVRGQFSRASAANNPSTLVSLPNDAPCYVPGKWGGSSQALSIWEGTTNLVYNSDFETVTTTAQLFADALTEYTGSSAAPWTVQSGSFTYSSSGATSGAVGSVITAGNPVWKPLLGSDGSTSLLLTAQATFTTPNPIISSGGSSWNGNLMLWQSAGNYYGAVLTGSAFTLYKLTGGTYATLATVAFTPAAATAYTFTISLDHTGALTAKLYLGTGTGGTLEETLTATDTSLSGGFLVGVGGDMGVIISAASVTGPWANTWSIGGDSRVAWGLTTSAINGTYSASAVGVASGVTGYITQATTVTSSESYDISGYMNTTSVGSRGAYVQLQTSSSYFTPPIVTGTTATLRYSQSATTTSTTGVVWAVITDAGSAVFDAMQLEQKAYATPYLRNDSTSATATRAADSLTLPTTLLSPSAGAIGGWFHMSADQQANSNWNMGLTVETSAPETNEIRFGKIATVGDTYHAKFANSSGTSWLPQFAISTGDHFVMLDWDSAATTATVYVDGVQVAQNTSAPLPSSFASQLWIGSYSGASDQWDSHLGPFLIFNRSLTPAEVYSLYAATEPLIDALATPIAPAVESLNSYATNPDSNDVYTTITYKRRDNTTESVAVFSNPVSGTSYYQTLVVTYYMADGATTQATDTWAIAYDANGKITSKVLQ